MPRLAATVSGRVQGVGFRDFVRREAAARGITGWVRNADDGRAVEVVAEGDQPALDALLAAIRSGPRFARVDDVATAWSEATNAFARFSIEM
jgi:acylphosphatase